MKNFLLAAVLLCGILISCKKSSSPSTTGCTLDTTSILGEYKIASVVFVSPLGSINGLTYFPACDTDNVYQLQADSVGNIIDAGVQCSPTPANATGKWSLSGTTLTTTLAVTTQQTLTGQISDFSCTGFVLTAPTTLPTTPAISGTSTITFVKQ